eukprot:2301232-Prymnesium_polylepis.1
MTRLRKPAFLDASNSLSLSPKTDWLRVKRKFLPTREPQQPVASSYGPRCTRMLASPMAEHLPRK